MQYNKKVTICLFYLLLIFSAGYISGCQSQSKEELDQLYSQAQNYFYKKQHDQALEYFLRYIKESKNIEDNHENLIWSIDQVGRIYLREKRDPDAAIRFFSSLIGNPKLSESDENDIQSWLSAVEDWKSAGQFPEMTKDPDQQFQFGKKFYDEGNRKLKYPLDDSGNADFVIAETYLIPFIINNDHDIKIGEALYMMGEIRRRLWNDKTYWGENFYFKEVIRRFPHTELARKSYQALEDGTHFGYTGSSGDNTPESVIKMLNTFKKLAEPE